MPCGERPVTITRSGWRRGVRRPPPSRRSPRRAARRRPDGSRPSPPARSRPASSAGSSSRRASGTARARSKAGTGTPHRAARSPCRTPASRTCHGRAGSRPRTGTAIPGWSSRRAGPVDAALPFEPVVVDAGEIRRQAAHLLPDLRTDRGSRPAGAGRLPQAPLRAGSARSHRISQSGRLSPTRRQRLADALDAAVGVGEGAVLLGERDRRQDDVRHLAGGVEEDVLADEEARASPAHGGRG